MTAATKALTVQSESPGTAVVPAGLLDLVKGYDGGGVSDLAQADRVTPFIGLVQGLSPQIDPQKPGYLEDAKIGFLFNTVTGEVYDGGEGLRVIPVLFQKAWNQWIPRKQGGGFLGSYADPELKQPIFVPPNGSEYDGPVDTMETANWFVLAEGKDGTWAPAIISMTSTKLKASRKWGTLTLINSNKYKTNALFVRIYTITSASETNEKGTFANYVIKDTDFVTPELFAMATELRKMVQMGMVRADMTKSTEVADAASDAADEVGADGKPKY